MYDFRAIKHKFFLREVFSACFEPVMDTLGNVPITMQKSRDITAYVLGVCRAYATKCDLKESTFELIVDAVYEELFRRDSIAVQTRAETWLQSSDKDFLAAYYHAKERTLAQGMNLQWLSDYANTHFRAKQFGVSK